MNNKALVAFLSIALFGYGLLVGGIFMLSGAAWAMIAGSVLPMAVGAVFLRGYFVRALNEPD